MFRTRRHAFAMWYTLLVALGFAALWRYGESLQRWAWDQYERQQAINQLTGGAKALAEGRYKAGDSVEELLAAYPADKVIRDEVYAEITYRSNVSGNRGRAIVVAKNGRLVLAWVESHSGDTMIFDTLPEAESMNVGAVLYTAWVARNNARIAVAGPAGVIGASR